MHHFSLVPSRNSLTASLRLLLVLFALLSLASCIGGISRGDDDDDDSADDDDATDDDDDDATDDDDSADDDDATDDDDDDDPSPFELEAMNFSGALSVSGQEGTITYSFAYYSEYSSTAQVLNCRQVIEADVWFAFGVGNAPDCNNCTGGLGVYGATVTDISNPSQDPEECDPDVLTASGYNYGMELVDPGGQFGDFATMKFMDDSVHEALGIDWGGQGGQTAAGFEEGFAEFGLDYVATGLVQEDAGTFTETTGLSGVASSAGPGSNWYGYWRMFRNPAENSHESTANNNYSLSGTYGLDGLWVVTGSAPLPD